MTQTAMRTTTVLLGVGSAYSAACAALRWATAELLGEALRPGPVPLGATLGLAAAVGAWLLLTWLSASLVVAVLAAAARARWGLCCTAERVTPALARRVAAAMLGVGMVGAPLGLATPAGAQDGFPASDRASDPLPGWTADRPAAPSGPADAAGPPLAAPGGRGAGLVVVRPGDTLWHIAARHLGPGASAADVAAEWPRWHAANRDRIGPDPHLVRPGLRLRAPGHPAAVPPSTSGSHR
jgi:hypothetical protein